MKRLSLLLFALFVFSVSAFSAVPNEIRYNGRLRSYQAPVNGTVQFNFKIYGQAEGGTAIWESGNQGIQISSGIFSYNIRPDATKVDWRKENLWLQLVVDGRELAPREKITSQPYSLHSQSAEKLSSNHDEIEIKMGLNKIYIVISNNKLYYRRSEGAVNECLGIPAGTVIAFVGRHPPSGYLLCNGQEVDSSIYPDLFDAIGTLYGGDGAKFQVPDFRGMFLRGVGGNAALLGQRQGDAIRNITGTVSPSWSGDVGNTGMNATGVFSTSYKDGSREATNNNNGWKLVFDASRVVPTASENRPVNHAVNYYIKY